MYGHWLAIKMPFKSIVISHALEATYGTFVMTQAGADHVRAQRDWVREVVSEGHADPADLAKYIERLGVDSDLGGPFPEAQVRHAERSAEPPPVYGDDDGYLGVPLERQS
jgi:hypothetical protein